MKVAYLVNLRSINMNQDLEKEFDILETPDLYFAAFLQVKKCKITKTEKQGNKTIFYFEVPKLVDYKRAYFNQQDEPEGLVSACEYSNAIKNLKTLCYIRKGDF